MIAIGQSKYGENKYNFESNELLKLIKENTCAGLNSPFQNAILSATKSTFKDAASERIGCTEATKRHFLSKL
jgi:hypothetical protein